MRYGSVFFASLLAVFLLATGVTSRRPGRCDTVRCAGCPPWIHVQPHATKHQEPESSGNKITDNTREDDADEALVLLGAHPTEFEDVLPAFLFSLSLSLEDVDSAAVEFLLKFNQAQTASLHKTVYVNPGTAPST
ncbi:hypothetical protein MTO96_024148 [Rhipicephalus appendiculatus]